MLALRMGEESTAPGWARVAMPTARGWQRWHKGSQEPPERCPWHQPQHGSQEQLRAVYPTRVPVGIWGPQAGWECQLASLCPLLLPGIAGKRRARSLSRC